MEGRRFFECVFLSLRTHSQALIHVRPSAALGITTSAFGAHYLKGKYPQLTPQSVQNWQTAGSYLIYNGIALLAISQHPRFGRHKYAGPLIITGS